MSDTINNYTTAIVSGNISSIVATLNPAIIVMPPGSNQANEGIQKNAMMLSAVAAVVKDFRFIRSCDGPDMWHTVLLEGIIDDTSVQFIDQVHVSGDGLVDHIDIFLRPASLAPVLLAKVTAEIQQRTTNRST